MIISLSSKFIFIANLKTASTTIEDALKSKGQIALPRTEWGKHQGLTEIQRRFDWVFEIIPLSEFFIFGVVRDPVDWLVSMYRSCAHPKFRDRSDVFTGNMSFDQFLTDWCARNPDSVQTQSLRLTSSNGDVRADLVIPYEQIELGVRHVCNLLALGVPDVKRLNVSPAEATRPDLTELQLSTIRQRYVEDYQLLRQAREKFSEINSSECSPPSRAPERQLPREDVLWAYRMILGREPESEAVIEGHRRHLDRESLRAAILKSREFLTRYGS